MESALASSPPAARLNRAFLKLVFLPLFVTAGMSAPGDPQEGELQAPLEPGTVQADLISTDLNESDRAALTEQDAKVSGYTNVRMRSRWTADGDDDDTDVYGVVGLTFDPGAQKGWSFHMLGRTVWSVDSQSPDSVFYSEQDTHSSDVTGDLYTAYVDMSLLDDFRRARFGRVLIYETPESIHFDGAQFETIPVGPTGFSIGAYGGSSVHLTESWPSDEWLAGAYATFKPWEQGTMRLDFMHFEDDDRIGNGDNDLITLGLNHRLMEDLRLEGQYSTLDGDPRDMRLKGFLVVPEQMLTVRVSYFQQFERELNFASELNPFYNFLNVSEPFDQAQINFTKSFDETLDLVGGIDSRRVESQGDIGRFNREFDRYFLTASMPDLLPMSTTLGLTGEVWDSPQNDISTWGLDLTSKLEDGAKASVGSYYSLYKYYLDVSAEREDVRTYYGEYKRDLSESSSFKVRYEYEDESVDSFHSVKLSVLWRF
jgi:hypothetical protein